VREVINSCFDWLVPVVQKYDGTVDKLIGDEIMAVFGAPVGHEDDAERALRAALDMMDAIVAFKFLCLAGLFSHRFIRFRTENSHFHEMRMRLFPCDSL
jgi:class 3 adenylate cyclase